MWSDSLSAQHSGISTDELLFSDIHLSLVHHHIIHKRGLPHIAFRRNYLSQLRALLPLPVALSTAGVVSPDSSGSGSMSLSTTSGGACSLGGGSLAGDGDTHCGSCGGVFQWGFQLEARPCCARFRLLLRWLRPDYPLLCRCRNPHRMSVRHLVWQLWTSSCYGVLRCRWGFPRIPLCFRLP